MKKSLKSLLVVLAMATAFVCAMAVASFADDNLYLSGKVTTSTSEYSAVVDVACDAEGWDDALTVVLSGATPGTWWKMGDYYYQQADSNGLATWTVWYAKYQNEISVSSADGSVIPNSVYINIVHELGDDLGYDSTCTEPGVKESYKCADCGRYFDGEGNVIAEGPYAGWGYYYWTQDGGRIDPKGHDYAFEVRESENPWYPGTRHDMVCTRCGDIAFFSPSNHAADENIQRAGGYPAECCKDGIREYYQCQHPDCMLYFRDAEGLDMIGDAEALEAWKKDSSERGGLLPAFGHKWDKGVVQKDGSTLYTCEVCGATKVEQGVKTGDAENMALWMMLAIAAMVAAGYVASRKEN